MAQWRICLCVERPFHETLTVKRDVKLLLDRALDSMVLAIEHFNRPYDRGRKESVLIHLNHSFELFMKAAILHRGGRIWKKKEQQTLGFEGCVNASLMNPKVKFLDGNRATTLRIINALRDAAEHFHVDLSESELYAHTQAGVTLFEDLMHEVFGASLATHIPPRVLPVSTSPPKDLYLVVDEKFDQVKQLILPGQRKKALARAALRSLALMDRAVRDNPNQPTDEELDEMLQQAAQGQPWQAILPGVAGISFVTEGTGLTVKLRITKNEGMPVRLVKEGRRLQPLRSRGLMSCPTTASASSTLRRRST